MRTFFILCMTVIFFFKLDITVVIALVWGALMLNEIGGLIHD